MRFRFLLLPLAMLCSTFAAQGAVFYRSADPADRARQKSEKHSAPLYHPAISEIDFYFDPYDAPEMKEPAFLNDPSAAYTGPSVQASLQQLDGQKLYDLDPAPIRRYYWKAPLYVVGGLPRDLVDAAFGVFGYIPVINLGVTGAYEYSGAQYLFRHPDDVHGYGGVENVNRHGFIEGESWGWFSNLNQTVFSEVDNERLQQLRAQNERIQGELRRKKELAEQQNTTAEVKAAEYLEQTLKMWDSGQERLALARLHNYSQAQPHDYRALAYYLGALVEELDRNTNKEERVWFNYETRRVASMYPHSHFDVLAEAMRQQTILRSESRAAQFVLTWTYSRMGSWLDALESAEILVKRPSARIPDYNLYAEVLLRRIQQLDKQEDTAELLGLIEKLSSVVGQMQRIDAKAVETRHAQSRLQVVRGEFDAGIAALDVLCKERPDDLRYRYQLGVAYMLQGMHSDTYHRSRAVRALKAAGKDATGIRAATIVEANKAARSIRN